MATKSDFAQKLLHDLRLRKERMAATQSSSHSDTAFRGSYGSSPGQGYKGSRQISALESAGYRSGNSFVRNRSDSRSYIVEDSSNQIVSYGRGTNPGQMGELSTALAFAFGNGGKLGKLDASGNIQMLNFLQHIGRRSMDNGTMEIRSNFGKTTSNTHFPTFSHIHINEVSKGVQKLNQILRTCSNGLNFDRYSIEVGRELLKGAMDLEESLRMLVNLQEASDYMISTQKKNKIKLLEDDEEDEKDTAKLTDMKQLDRPRFSFDKPSRDLSHHKETANNGIKEQFVALKHPEDNPRLQPKQCHSTLNSISHTRTASYLPDYETLSTFLGPKTQSISSQSTIEKGRISNVIAKLMGLDELPPKGDIKTTHKEKISKRQDMTIKHGVSADSSPQQADMGTPFSTQRKKASAQITPPKDTASVKKAEKVRAIRKGSSKVVISEENFHQQDTEMATRIDAGSVPKIATIIMDKQQSNVNQPIEVARWKTILQEEGKKEDDYVDKGSLFTKRGESKDIFMNNEPQPKAPEKRRMTDDDASENTEIKRNAVQTGKKNPASFHQSKQRKHQHDPEHLQPQVLKRSNHQQEKKKQLLPKQKLQDRKSKVNSEEPVVASKPKVSAKGVPKKQSCADPSAAGKKKSLKHVDVKPSKGTSNSRGVVHAICEPYMHVPHSMEKPNHIKVNAGQTNQKIDAATSRINGTLDHPISTPTPQSPVQKEMKQKNEEKVCSTRVAKQDSEPQSKSAEAGITKFTEMEGSSQLANREEQLQNEADNVIIDNSGENEHQGLDCPKSFSSSDKPRHIVREELEALEYEQPSVPPDDLQFQSFNDLLTPDRGEHRVCTQMSKHAYQGQKKIPSSGQAELLTETEKQLKEILIKGQLFLNTAEALFKLNIPVSILHGSDHNGQDPESKLILDCAYELLKKKGRRQEISIYPCKDKSIGHIMIKSFDDLIKQLRKDFDTLKFSGGEGSEECAEADYLQKMLENDIKTYKPDVNSTWDFSWNEKTFAFLEKYDIVKDVEKHILNGLLDEITSDLLDSAVSA